MMVSEKKKIIREKYLRPKTILRRARREKEYTIAYMAEIIGLQRRQYEKKEAGEYPFNDYEMKILSQKLNIPIAELFF